MEKLKNLEQLYISHNGIEILENLEQNNSLTTLDLASNRISKLDNLKPLENIEEFWFNDNLVIINLTIITISAEFIYLSLPNKLLTITPLITLSSDFIELYLTY